VQNILVGAPGPGRTAPAPVRRRPALGAPLLVVLSFAVAAPLSELLAAIGGRHGAVLGTVVLGVAALVVGWFGRPLAGVVIGPVFWLFFDGFVVDRSGSLGWNGRTDAVALAVLVGAGLAGGLLGVLVPRVRAGGVRLRAAIAARLGRASLEPFAPGAPPRGHSWYWN